MKYIKLVIIYTCRFLLRLLYLRPVRRGQIYLSADKGSGVRDNPLYIYRYMKKRYPGEFRYVWESDRHLTDPDTLTVRPGSLRAIFYQVTSQVLISNDGFGSYLPKRKSQLFINTWHGGGAYKKSGVDFVTDQHPVDLRINKLCGAQTDIFISSSKKFSDVMSTAKMVPRDRFLEVGMPRNDLLVKQDRTDLPQRVREYFRLPPETKLVLYAPTYRGEENSANFDSDLAAEGCLKALQQRFGGEWVLLVRKHHFVKQANLGTGLDASGYPDMQELLYAVDVFITDYSSTIWDFALTKKPGFLFTPDLADYTKDRSFYTEPETWAFPLALTNRELQDNIRAFEEQQNAAKIQQHQELLGNFDMGNATEQVVNKIVEFTKGAKNG